jgi:hypothetical protein
MILAAAAGAYMFCSPEPRESQLSDLGTERLGSPGPSAVASSEMSPGRIDEIVQKIEEASGLAASIEARFYRRGLRENPDRVSQLVHELSDQADVLQREIVSGHNTVTTFPTVRPSLNDDQRR